MRTDNSWGGEGRDAKAGGPHRQAGDRHPSSQGEEEASHFQFAFPPNEKDTVKIFGSGGRSGRDAWMDGDSINHSSSPLRFRKNLGRMDGCHAKSRSCQYST